MKRRQKIMTKCRRPSAPKAVKGKHVTKGRNFCTVQQQQVITPLRASRGAPYTPRGTSPASPTPNVSPNSKLTEEERLECWSLYVPWVMAGKKVKDSPIPFLKAKYKACEADHFFTGMLKRSVETGSIWRKFGSGRPVVYDSEVYDPIIMACVTSQRLKQRMAPSSLILLDRASLQSSPSSINVPRYCYV